MKPGPQTSGRVVGARAKEMHFYDYGHDDWMYYELRFLI